MANPKLRTQPGMIATIAAHEYLVNLRRPGFIFFTLLIPALGLIGLIVVAFFSGQATRFLENQFGGAGANLPMGVVDRSALFTPLPPAYAAHYQAFADEAEARQALLAKRLAGYLVIPDDYLQSGRITVYSTGGFFDTVTAADSDTLRGFLVSGLLAGKVDPAVAARAADPADVTPVTLDENGQPTSGGDPFSTIAGFIIPYLLSIFLVISIFTASSYLLRSVSEEKESRVIEVVLSSVSATELLAGKVLGLGALGLTQVLVWLVSGFALTGGLGSVAAGVVIALNPLAFGLSAVYFLLGYLLYGTLMAAAGAMGTSMRESQQLAGIFSFASAVPLMFNSLILTSPNGTLTRVLSIFPLTAPTAMMLRLPLAGQLPVLDLLLSLAGLLFAIPFVLWGSARLFRMGLLLYGKRPSLRQIVRTLRQAA